MGCAMDIFDKMPLQIAVQRVGSVLACLCSDAMGRRWALLMLDRLVATAEMQPATVQSVIVALSGMLDSADTRVRTQANKLHARLMTRSTDELEANGRKAAISISEADGGHGASGLSAS